MVLHPSHGCPPLGSASRSWLLVVSALLLWLGKALWRAGVGTSQLLGWPSDRQLPHVGAVFRSMDTCISMRKWAGEGPIPPSGSSSDLQKVRVAVELWPWRGASSPF